MLVKVKGKGVKLNGVWKYKNEEAEIDEIEYEENKEFLDIIEDEEGPKLPQVPGKPDEDNENELQELRAKAKELGIKNYHLMGKEKLELAIEEKEAPLFSAKTVSTNENSNTNLDDSNNDRRETTVEDNTQE